MPVLYSNENYFIMSNIYSTVLPFQFHLNINFPSYFRECFIRRLTLIRHSKETISTIVTSVHFQLLLSVLPPTHSCISNLNRSKNWYIQLAKSIPHALAVLSAIYCCTCTCVHVSCCSYKILHSSLMSFSQTLNPNSSRGTAQMWYLTSLWRRATEREIPYRDPESITLSNRKASEPNSSKIKT